MVKDKIRKSLLEQGRNLSSDAINQSEGESHERGDAINQSEGETKR